MLEKNISVVIPAYNAADFIEEALDGIFKQTLLPNEVVIIDDGSIDKTCQIIQDWVSKSNPTYSVIVRSQVNSGISATRNLGIKIASGIWIAFLDADDIWEPMHLELLYAALELLPSAIASYGGGRLLEDGITQEGMYDDFWDNPSKKYGKKIDGSSFCSIDSEIFPRLIKGNFIKPSSLMVSSAAIQKSGSFREDLGTAEDREFLIRLILMGSFVYVPEAITKYRWHNDNASQVRNAKRNAENGLLAIQMVGVNKSLALTSTQMAACTDAITASAKDYLYICCQRGWQDYMGGIAFICQHLGWMRVLSCISLKQVVRSFWKSPIS
ncbi:glycosyltransferase family 2 protein [Rhodoferax sp.]|uniref:glycosyltransferase family 2 protein n=1 Tax=Rhodoferax sp. TaxID=50421 RepID=UPI00374DD551